MTRRLVLAERRAPDEPKNLVNQTYGQAGNVEHSNDELCIPARRSYRPTECNFVRAASVNWQARQWCVRSDVDDVSTVPTRSVRTEADVQDKQVSLPARRCRSQVATEQERPPVSETWLARYKLAKLSQLTKSGTTPQKSSLYVGPHAQASVNVDPNVTGSTITPSTVSADAGKRCWRRLVVHRRTSVFDGFNWSLSYRRWMGGKRHRLARHRRICTQ